jgi:hypothetical protein
MGHSRRTVKQLNERYMLKIDKLVAGQIQSFVHTKIVEFKGKEKASGEHAPAWLSSCVVTRRAAFKGNVAGKDSYANKMRREQGEDWEAKRKPWFQFTPKDGIVCHRETGSQYLAVLNPEVIKSVYFVDGIEATEAQLEDIKRWRKSSGEFGDFACFGLDSVEYAGGTE